jgi:hypothetical protein
MRSNHVYPSHIIVSRAAFDPYIFFFFFLFFFFFFFFFFFIIDARPKRARLRPCSTCAPPRLHAPP